MINEENICLCALNRIFGFDPRIGLELIRNLGSAAAVFSTGRDEIRAIMGPYGKYMSQITDEAVKASERELLRLREHGAVFVGIGDKCYPAPLRECPDAPLGFYIKTSGETSAIFDGRPAIAVVGTRDISPYGREWCVSMVKAMARSEKKPLIVSGLAIGVDITAHLTALECGLPTLAVMATGIDAVYPFRHEWAARKIADTAGCGLLTDYPPCTSPKPLNFLRRNRIIAGMSHATILVESRLKGGGMMTANLAFNYSRDVYALPGRIDDARSQGCNYLIGEKIAEAITGPEVLISRLGLGKIGRRTERDIVREVLEAYSGSLPPEQAERVATLAGLIRGNRGIGLDSLCAATGWTYSEVSGYAGLLESDGFICMDLLQNCTIKPKFV